MTPATPLCTVTLPLSAVTLPPSALTHGNVTVHKGRQPTHAPGTTSHSSSRSQGTNTGNGTPNRMWTNTGNTIPDTHKNLARKHGCSGYESEVLESVMMTSPTLSAAASTSRSWT